MFDRAFKVNQLMDAVERKRMSQCCFILFALDCANSRYRIRNTSLPPFSIPSLPRVGSIPGPTDYYISNIWDGFTEQTLSKALDMI